MIVLNPCHRTSAATLGFVGDGVCEPKIDGFVTFPILRAKLEMLDEHVAQRPQSPIREPVVIPVDVGLVEPDAMERVATVPRRNHHAAGFIGDFVISGAGTPCDPGAMRVPHGGIERADETTGWLLHLDAALAVHVLVWLAIRDEHELAIA